MLRPMWQAPNMPKKLGACGKDDRSAVITG
jgi:hypothetical protein